MLLTQVHLTLPAWIHEYVDPRRAYADDGEQMQLAIELAARNVQLGTGGPFGAALFDHQGQLVGLGVNRVVDQSCSVAHAEMMAFMTAQQHLRRFRLNEEGSRFTLATSAQPCCQCYGACFWAGIDTLLIGASAQDVHELTEFDEGPLPQDWQSELRQRGIDVRTGLQREAARTVLASYQSTQGRRY